MGSSHMERCINEWKKLKEYSQTELIFKRNRQKRLKNLYWGKNKTMLSKFKSVRSRSLNQISKNCHWFSSHRFFFNFTLIISGTLYWFNYLNDPLLPDSNLETLFSLVIRMIKVALFKMFFFHPLNLKQWKVGHWIKLVKIFTDFPVKLSDFSLIFHW